MGNVPNHDYGNALVAVYSTRFMLQVFESWQPEPRFWKFPGGGIERGETPMMAAVREVFEETGVRIRERELVLQAVIEKPGRKGGTFLRHFFTAKIADRRIRAHASSGIEGEAIRYVLRESWRTGFYPEHQKLFDNTGIENA